MRTPRLGYAFGGPIIKLCKHVSVPEDPLDYFPHIKAPPHCVINIKRPVLTSIERVYRDELIMDRIYRLEMLCHKAYGRPSTLAELDEVEARFPLNDYANVVLGTRPQFFEL